MNPDPHQQFPRGTFAGLTNPHGEGSRQTGDPQFDIFEWYPQYQSCQRYFLDHAQHSVPVQALASFVNIRLPFQRQNPTFNYSAPRTPSPGPAGLGRSQPFRLHSPPSPSLPSANADPCVTLIPVSRTPKEPFNILLGTRTLTLTPQYLRRLVATGMDFPGVLHGFFGDDWAAGVGPLHVRAANPSEENLC
jgi:hypothetical protein